uniref:Nop domain-containing protein n=1 Tax=Soboliphyme baturini TaxID=241478 RepID=A0A183IKF0_9BILA
LVFKVGCLPDANLFFQTGLGTGYDSLGGVELIGSLMNLAKMPASTVQILGAEKALFRALKAKRDTPKYGLIYHAHLIGHTPAKLKGKMSRMLAAKASLACRVDALGEGVTSELGVEHRARLEQRLQSLQEHGVHGFYKSNFTCDYETYDVRADSTMPPRKKHIVEISTDEGKIFAV